jgi:hypothetical protein
MAKSMKVIVALLLFSLTAWGGFKYGQYRQVLHNSLQEQSELIVETRLDIKAVKLLDDNEIDRLRTMLISQIESDIEFIETWDEFENEAKWWTAFTPTKTSMSWIESNLKEEIERNRRLVETEYNRIR